MPLRFLATSKPLPDNTAQKDAVIVHVTDRGGLHVDADELFSNSKVQQTLEKAAQLHFGSTRTD